MRQNHVTDLVNGLLLGHSMSVMFKALIVVFEFRIPLHNAAGRGIPPSVAIVSALSGVVRTGMQYPHF